MAKPSKSSSASAIEVDMVSDFVCPWCWLGYRQFQVAQKQFKSSVNIAFRPYMLDPTVPDAGADYKTYMKAKFGDGPSDKFKTMRDHLETAGPDFGIAFDFNAITRRPNTLSAHRLMRWAQGQDLGAACAENLFRAYLEDGLDIGDIAVLCAIAEEIGMDGDIVADLLASDNDKIDVQNEIMFFRGLGISGVPTFIYNGQFALQGAQDAPSHLKAMAEARALPAET
ncbi:DsbA family protein [Litorimonas sp. RW-G-Af-16]|uniref:DsbA family oxidoreductase n=1 Tax=Litorimonas sp. RW-G-Af-16 TaxID=3241168 RepID=UPI00390C6399